MDIESILIQISTDNPEDKVCESLDEEINSGNWVEDDWEDDYCSEYDWYQDHGNGEAEGVIVTTIITGWQNKYNNGKEIDPKIRSEIYEGIKESYDCLYKA